MPDIIKELKQMLEIERLSGITEFYRDKAGKTEKPSEAGGGGYSPDPGNLTADALRKRVADCTLCRLCETRTNTVFGEGSESAELMFIGEAPGKDEDIQGRPFVGRAGKLLTDIIQAMGLQREQVYIANILKCRPPANRNPLPEEISKCIGYLSCQIKTIRPKVICALGKFSAQTLLSTETPISALRGKFYDYHGVKLMPTYHPAYLLRNSSGKREVWEDMKAIAAELGIKVPSKKNKPYGDSSDSPGKN